MRLNLNFLYRIKSYDTTSVESTNHIHAKCSSVPYTTSTADKATMCATLGAMATSTTRVVCPSTRRKVRAPPTGHLEMPTLQCRKWLKQRGLKQVCILASDDVATNKAGALIGLHSTGRASEETR